MIWKPLDSTSQNSDQRTSASLEDAQSRGRTATVSSPLESLSDPSPAESSIPDRAISDTGNLATPAQLRSMRWWQRVSVKTKVTALAVALGVVPVLAVGGVAIYFANRIIVQSALEGRQRLAVDISFQLNNFVLGRLHDVETIASTPLVKNSSQTNPDELVNYINSFVARDSTYGEIAAATPDGSFLYLDQNKAAFRTTNVDVPSKLEAAGAKPFAEINAAYFLETGGSLRPVAAFLRPSVITGKPSFYAAAPILNSSGKQLSALVYSQTDVSDISELIRVNLINLVHQGGGGTDGKLPDFEVVDQGIAFFEKTSDAQDQEIPASRIEARGNSIKIDGKPFKPGGKIFTKENRVIVSNGKNIGVDLETIFPKYIGLRDSGVAATVTDVSQKDGKEYVLSYAPIARVEGLPLDWGVLVYEPASSVFAPQRTLILALLLGTVLSAMLVGSIAAALANRATRPVLKAATAVEKIGQGDLATRLEVRGDDELAALGSNINTMAAQLQTLVQTQSFEAAQERLLTAAKGSGILRAADLADIFDQAVDEARHLLQLDRVVIYRFGTESSDGIITESVSNGWTSAMAEHISDSCIPNDLRAAYQEGRVVAIANVADASLHPEHLDLLQQLQVQANLIVPILSGTQLYGLLVAHHCAGPHEWQPFEINFLKRLGTELGLSIYRVDLLEQTEKQAEEQRYLKEGLQNRALELLMEVEPISKGDLTTRARVTADEIGTIADSYNATVESLRRIVLQVQDAAGQMAETTSANQTSVASLSADALQQAEAIASALGVVQEMADVVRDVAANAEQAELVVQEASQTVELGDVTMNRTVEGMQSIRATVAETAKKVKRLGESSQKISTVVELISAFAAQTKMLALNASIEASRAGEEGRGFAVVAAEVRALAQQSAEATEEIRKLVMSIQAETNDVVATMESGTQQVVTGTQLVDETRQSLNKITIASAQLGRLVEEIAQATVVQFRASETIAQTMQDVAAIANKTSTEAQQVSSSFEQLQQVTQTLQAGVGQFKV
jgi:methyl-accepting chemotaxis protein